MFLLPVVLAALAGLGPIASASALQVDLGYSIYNGVPNATSGLNIWKGCGLWIGFLCLEASRYMPLTARVQNPLCCTGELRWQAPQVPETDRSAVIDADKVGPSCPQAWPAIPNTPPFSPGDEDCLFLNVFAPNDAQNLPVFVWIHGGGYGIGDGSQDMTIFINGNANKFIAVAIQYRLEAFGYLASTEVKAKGVLNAGIFDQEFAIKWAKEKIHLFGGDPSKITIAGQSAGAGSVLIHTISKGGTVGNSLFTNLFSLSTSTYRYNDTEPESRYLDFAQRLGCTSAEDRFKCIVAKDMITLQEASTIASSIQRYGTWVFQPVVDDSYIRERPSLQLLRKQINADRILIGSNANKGPLFVPQNITTQDNLIDYLKTSFPRFTTANIQQILDTYPSSSGPANPDDPKYATSGYGPGTTINISQVATGQQQRANNIYAEVTFVCPSYYLARSSTGYTGNAYQYQYLVPFSSHGEELSAIFGPETPNQSPDFVLAFTKIWGNFITQNNPSISAQLADGVSTGNSSAPNPATNWPRYKDSAHKLINLIETGGTPYIATTNFGASVTQFEGPTLRNEITVADADKWEGNRGKRYDFWQGLGHLIPA